MPKNAGIKVNNGGFSLIELMVVVAIVATLAAVAMPAYYNYLMRSRQTTVIGGLMSIKAAQEQFYAERGAYAGKMNTLPSGVKPDGTIIMYAVAGTYSAGGYEYWVTANTTAWITAGTIRALGDPNGDGVAHDGWEVSIDRLEDKPKPYVTGGDEGFGWSSLAHLF